MHLTIVRSALTEGRPEIRSRCLDCSFESDPWEHEDPAYLAGLRHACPTSTAHHRVTAETA